MPATSLSESLSSLLAATVAFAIGTSVVLRDRRRDNFVLFAVFCFNLGLFHLARFFFGFSQLSIFGWFAQTISVLLPWTAGRSLSSFVPAVGGRRYEKIQRRLGTLLVLAQTVVLFFPSLRELPQWEVVPMLLGTYVIVGLLLAITRVWRAARAAEGTSAAPRLRYVFYASIAALALGSSWVPAVGPIVTAVYLYFVAQTLVRERLLDLPEVALRIASLSVLVVVVTGLYALLLLWIPARDASNRSLFVFNAAVASFAVLVLLEPVRTEIESRLESWLYRDRRVMRRILLQLRLKLLNVIDPDEMAKLVVAELQASGRVTQASLYLIDRQGSALVLSRHLGPVPLARLDLATRRPLLERMLRHGTQLRDVLQRERERARAEAQVELDEMLETMGAIKGSLALPIVGALGHGDDRTEPELLGALFVDDERLLEPFSREEIELFEGVAAQAATTIANSAVYEGRKERDRLAALGEMAAGLAHEIRNPLGAIKGAVQVMESIEDKSGPQAREFLDVIVEEVDRLNRVVSQFLTYSRPFKGELSPVDPRDIVHATVRLLPDAVQKRVKLRAHGEIPTVRADGDALRQVLHNLVLNALDATAGISDPKIEIALSVRQRGLLRGDALAIDVRDNGPGLSSRTMTNLFVPFHTTKSGGTGLGLPISQRIVENHHGVIEVANNPEGGARFTVLLPVQPELGPADAAPRDASAATPPIVPHSPPEARPT
ncbi:MAG: GAF domain-containing protein [Deltaproteobacteria bacterium]|nr:GAF domain-containing protein [Deltaproteobacteria bacterium]MBK8239027.1 GAF domain-containing protein [Deltaproteobacteria bacterium]MBK8717540.1 GAF domain-containing protein [Deltaproteobacteria bacterium]MBP7285852.1 GAF domain-containing protein [Nannocystaceae bacterium]